MNADRKSKEMLNELNVRRKSEGRFYPWPLVKANSMMEEKGLAGWLRDVYLQENYRETVNHHKGYYSDCYRCLGYLIYGYGYLSNNERRMAGLKPKRFRRRR